uniref:Transcription factor bHLH131 n=1 Tax=Anthurium amnicola TaxID=1678845 RepID=A0A1D1XKM8_9ARAE
MTTSVAMAETPTSTAPAAGSKREQPPTRLQHQYHIRQLNPGAGCGGEGCVAWDPWPVHHIRHRGSLCRLCTSCVLRYHPGSFCPKCFELVDSPGGRLSPQQPPGIVHCNSCPSVCHAACLSDADKAASYVCPSCANPSGYSYFPVDCDRDGDGDASGSPSKKVRVADGGGGEEKLQAEGQRHRTVDRESAKVLLCAARLASASMNRAVAFARSEAERKAKDAVVARKKAKEMLEKALTAAKREREKRQDVLVVPLPAVAEPQRKASAKLDNAMASMVAQKRRQNREKEQWMKLEDAIPLTQKPPVRAIAESERAKDPFPSSHLNHSHAVTPNLQDNVKLDTIGNNGSLPASKINFAAENKKGGPKVPVESGVGVRVPPTKQDASVTKTNTRVIFTGLPDKTSLHS